MRLLQDVRIAIRTAARSRFVSVLAVIAFALGIGVTTAVFSIFNGVLLRPLPFPHAEQLVAVYDTQPAERLHPSPLVRFGLELVRPHPRARVWEEERHRYLPSRLLRPVYWYALYPVIRLLCGRGSRAR